MFFIYFEIIESESLGECEVFGFEMNMSIISWKQGFNAEPQSFSKLPIVPGRILAFPLITNKFKRQSSVAGKLQRIFFWIQNCENYWHFFWAFSWMSCFRFIFLTALSSVKYPSTVKWERERESHESSLWMFKRLPLLYVNYKPFTCLSQPPQ